MKYLPTIAKYRLAMLDLGYLLLVLLTACSLFLGSFNMGAAVAVCLALLVVIVAWIVMAVIVSRRRKKDRAWRSIYRVGLPLLVLVPVAISSANDRAFGLAFRLSRPAMDKLARNVMAAPAGTVFAPRQIRFFAAADIHRTPWGMQFRSDYGHMFDDNGFAYCPDGVPTDPRTATTEPFMQTRYTRIEGAWYQYWAP